MQEHVNELYDHNVGIDNLRQVLSMSERAFATFEHGVTQKFEKLMERYKIKKPEDIQSIITQYEQLRGNYYDLCHGQLDVMDLALINQHTTAIDELKQIARVLGVTIA